VDEFSVLPPERCVCPQCGKPLLLHGDTEDSEQIEIKVRAYRRVIHRRRYQRTPPATARSPSPPPAPKLIPKGRYGISVWVEILLDKDFSFRPTERLLASWELLGLNLAPGTVTDRLGQLEVLLRPIYQALRDQNRQGDSIKPMRRGGRCSSSWRAGGIRLVVMVRLESRHGRLPLDLIRTTRSPRTTLGPSHAEWWWSTAIRRIRR
jgi:hypothetical protein